MMTMYWLFPYIQPGLGMTAKRELNLNHNYLWLNRRSRIVNIVFPVQPSHIALPLLVPPLLVQPVQTHAQSLDELGRAEAVLLQRKWII